MKRKIFVARQSLLTAAASLLLFSACVMISGGGDNDEEENHSFNIYLQGTWKNNTSTPEVDGITLEINDKTIRVTGQGTPPVLSAVIKGPLQNGYSEETGTNTLVSKKGIFYITDMVNGEIEIIYNYLQDVEAKK